MKKIFLPILLISNLCFAQVNLNLGLRAYYPFSGNANDVSGNNNNPVFNNATLTADRFGNANSAYHFNGTSSYMKILNSTSLNSTNKLSLVAWVKPQGFYAGTCHGNSILMKGDADYLTGNYLLRFDDGPYSNFNNCATVMDPAHQNFYGAGANSNAPGYTPYIQTNQWYSLIVTYDGTTARLYVNCELKATQPQGSATFTNSYDIFLGRLNSSSFPYWFNGDLDEVRIYDRTLNAAEVSVLNGTFANAGNDTSFCSNGPVSRVLQGSGGGTYSWSPAVYLNNPNLQNPTATISTTTTFYLTVSSGSVCTAIDSVTIYVNPVPVIQTLTDTAICKGSVLVLTTTPGAGTYHWSPGIYVSDSTIASPLFIDTLPRTLVVTGTTALGCFAKDTINISIKPLPVVKTIEDTLVCSNIPVTLFTGGAQTYIWTPTIFLSNPNIANPVFSGNSSQTYYVTGTAANGCSAKDTINITIKPLPIVKTIEDTLICSNNLVTLFTGGAQTYSWTPTIFLSNPNIANPVFSGNSSQTYYVTGTATNGCTAKDTVSVNVNLPMAMQAPPDKSMCGNGSVQLDGYNGNTVSYLWSPPTYLSSTTIINPIASPPATTAYAVKISDAACNYDSTFTVQVIVGAAISITVSKSNDIDCANHSATLLASGGDTYLWTPSTGLSNPNIPNPVATPTATQKYVVLVSNASGCSNSDSVTVYSDLKASLARYMPNAFTPNGDGLNDCFGLKNWMHIKKLEFRIFNRYGEQIFYTSDPSRCWDGTYKGKKSDPGTYVFYIKAETDCGTEEQKGNFLLIR